MLSFKRGVDHSLYSSYVKVQVIYSVFLKIPENMVYLANGLILGRILGNMVEYIPTILEVFYIPCRNIPRTEFSVAVHPSALSLDS